jgi:sortase A
MSERRRPSVPGVIGELLITAGVLVLLFLGWQVWWNSLVLAGQQTNAAASQSKQWLDQASASPTPAPTPTKVPGKAKPDYGPPPVMEAPAAYQPFAVIYVPRLGPEWKRIIKQTVDVDQVLNSYTAGVGHYPDTQMPGAVGNFAVAGHDSGWGNAFIDLSKLRLNDAIYVQTKDGWYTYRFRNFEYVQPNAVSVLYPVPRQQGATPVDRIMTITTCNPPFHAAERLIAYNLFDSWQPLSAGPPAEIAAQVAAQGG